MKENKYRIIIDNVYCESAKPEGSANFEILKIEPFDDDYIKGKTGFSSTTLPEKKAKVMMSNLKSDLQGILDNYVIQIKKVSNKKWRLVIITPPCSHPLSQKYFARLS